MKKILNILLVLMMLATAGCLIYAVVSGGTDEAIGLNLIWTYVLVGLGLVAAVACALAGMVTSPEGIKGAVVSVVLGAIVLGASYFFASSHTVLISDIGNGGFFPSDDTVITEASVLVTYTICAAAVVVAVFSEIWGALK